MKMKLSNVRKKNKGTTKCAKELLHVMLDLYNATIAPSNVRKKKKKENHRM